MKRIWLLFACMLMLVANFCTAQSGASKKETFTNPLLSSGPDPWCIYKDGFYYYTHTTGRNITIWKTKSIATLSTAENKVVWTPPASGPYSKDIWAPEVHYLEGKWYVYFAADSGNNTHHRLWVLECASQDPINGEWKVKGQLATPDNKWAIDGSVFTVNNKHYLIWSGWEGDTNGRQDIYIAAMKNPWTVEGKRTLISKPDHAWERNGDLNNPNDVPHIDVNEGPEILQHGNKLFLIYSASACWTDTYALGMLSTTIDKDLLDASSWVKSPEPVFKQSLANKVYAPGHNCFFVSPNGKENWILYHANSKPGQGCTGLRSPRAQKFTWKQDGSPDFGVPLPEGQPLEIPAE